MNINIDVECTPEEARRCLGLPDVAPLQQAMMEELQRRMSAGLESLESEDLMKTWLPGAMQGGLQGMDQLQKMFWSQMHKAAAESGGKGSGSSPRDKT